MVSFIFYSETHELVYVSFNVTTNFVLNECSVGPAPVDLTCSNSLSLETDCLPVDNIVLINASFPENAPIQCISDEPSHQGQNMSYTTCSLSQPGPDPVPR